MAGRATVYHTWSNSTAARWELRFLTSTAMRLPTTMLMQRCTERFSEELKWISEVVNCFGTHKTLNPVNCFGTEGVRSNSKNYSFRFSIMRNSGLRKERIEVNAVVHGKLSSVIIQFTTLGYIYHISGMKSTEIERMWIEIYSGIRATDIWILNDRVSVKKKRRGPGRGGGRGNTKEN